MSTQTNAAMAHKLYTAFNNDDFDTCLHLSKEDVEVVLIPFNQTFHGREGFRNFMTGFKTAFPDLTVTITNQVVAEDQLVTECRWRGTHTGPLQSPAGEMPPTGKRVEDAAFCEVWSIKDGQLAMLRNYQDVSSWLRQLGLAS